MKRAPLIFLLLAAMAGGAHGWEESDFPPRPVVAYTFSRRPGPDYATVVGEPRSYTFANGDTLHDVARHLGLGINEVQGGLPDVDVWLPPEGETEVFPTWWILPASDYRGVVVNIPEMRLYYFPPRHSQLEGVVITYPVGLGRDDWRTPTGPFVVREKTIDPEWVIPDSIREEHIVERGDPRKKISGGDPDNPLGHYRLRLSLPLLGIHGTNIPWGVGMQVSHGCIRLYPEDIERLFGMVSVGTPGEIVYEPVKVGARHGDVYVEVENDIYDLHFEYQTEVQRLLGEKGWSNVVDWGLVEEALAKKSGVPTPITVGAPLLKKRSRDVDEAHTEPDGSLSFTN